MMLDFLDNQYTKQRIQKAQQLRELGHNPYNNVCVRTLCNAAFVAKFAHLQKEPREDSVRESVVGRIRFLRLMGKAAFVTIQDDSGILQL
ncbi:MAG: lysine--tRNA ligase, partial [Helicobacter sp.]|nr:lysine--tRNA ligase [Helicobacter sp.]